MNPALHNYYNPRNALQVAKIVAAWKQDNFKPQELECINIGVQPGTLRAQIQWGLKWLSDNAAEQATRDFFTDIQLTTMIHLSGTKVQLFRQSSADLFMKPLDTSLVSQMLEDLKQWIASKPDVRDKWPRNRTTWNLTPDQITEFQNIYESVKDDFIAKISQHEVTFVRFPAAAIADIERFK